MPLVRRGRRAAAAAPAAPAIATEIDRLHVKRPVHSGWRPTAAIVAVTLLCVTTCAASTAGTPGPAPRGVGIAASQVAVSTARGGDGASSIASAGDAANGLARDGEVGQLVGQRRVERVLTQEQIEAIKDAEFAAQFVFEDVRTGGERRDREGLGASSTHRELWDATPVQPLCPDDAPSDYTLPCDVKPNCTLPPAERVCLISEPHELDLGANVLTCNYNFQGSLVMSGSGRLWKAPCGGSKGAVHPCECDVVINITEALYMTDDTSINVPSLVLYAGSVLVNTSATIDASAMGPQYHGAEVQDNIDGTDGGGGGHAGMGGVAGEEESQCASPYGQLTRGGAQYGSISDPWSFGGAGGGRAKNSFHNTFSARGGGRVNLIVQDRIRIYGYVAVDGGAVTLPSTLAQGGGGAGGSIQVTTQELSLASDTGILSARGGDSSIGGGGSGGRISLNCASKTSLRADVYGGRHGTNTNCGTGATGTIYDHADQSFQCGGGGTVDGLSGDLVATTALVSDEDQGSIKFGQLSATNCLLDASSWDGNGDWLHAVVMSASTVRLASVYVNGSITMTSNSRLLPPDGGQQDMTIYATSVKVQDSLISSSETSGAGSDLVLHASDSLTVGKRSFIHFAHAANISATTILIENDVSEVDLADMTRLMMRASETLTFSRASNIAADYIVLQAPQITVQGIVTANQALLARCTHAVVEPACFQDPAPLVFSAPQPLYTAWIQTQQLHVESSGSVQGAAISVCALNATIAGSIDASQFGCGADVGRGAGEDGATHNLPGGGGGHGGNGGNGGAAAGKPGVSSAGGLKYDNFTVVLDSGSPSYAGPSMLGSGGGGSSLGGSGGGLVRAHVSDLLQLSGSIVVDGGNGLSQFSGGTGDTSGGGGAGGTLLLHLNRIDVTSDLARLSAVGGDGGDGAGGGGGGIVLAVWIKNKTRVLNAQRKQSVVRKWGGSGGDPSSGIQAGSDGLDGIGATIPGCDKGRGGLFCYLCRPGSFSDAWDTRGCLKCPLGSFQNGTGATACMPCPKGQFSDGIGSSKCQVCPPGLSPNAARTACTLCAEGWEPVCNGTASPTCKHGPCRMCAAGSATSGPGTPPLPPGRTQPVCHVCPAGTYAPTKGTPRCLPCAAGRYAPSRNTTTCTKCAKGHITSPDLQGCTKCPAGRQVAANRSYCEECGINTASKDGKRCVACDPGSFAVVHSGACTKCEDKTPPMPLPHFARWTETDVNASTSLRCDFECTQGYLELATFGRECYSPEQVAVEAVGGEYVCVSLVVLGFGAVMVPEVLRRRRRGGGRRRRPVSGVKAQEMPGLRLSRTETRRTSGLAADAAAAGFAQLAGWGTQTLDADLSLPRAPGGKRRKRKKGKKRGRSAALAFDDQAITVPDLPWHLHRVYFHGRNSGRKPFVLPDALPGELSTIAIPDRYVEYATMLSRVSAWGSLSAGLHKLLTVLYYPLSVLLLHSARRSSALALLELHSQYDHSFLANTRARALAQSLKLCVSPDATLAWLDVLCEQGEDTGGLPIGQPRVPLVLMCMGDGAYITPWRLDLTDPLVISALQCLGADWRRIAEGLNSVLRTLPRGAVADRQELLAVQTFLSLTNEEAGAASPDTPMLYLGVAEEDPRLPRMAVLLLPREVPVGRDGAYPFYVPYGTRVLPVKTSRSRGDCCKAVLSWLSFPTRNTTYSIESMAGCTSVLLGTLVVTDMALGLLLLAGLYWLYIQAFWVVLLVPLASGVLAPVTGLYAQVADSPDAFRVYAHLNLLSMVNAIAAVLICTLTSKDLTASGGVTGLPVSITVALVYPLTWLVIKLLIAALVNVQVAYLDHMLDAAALAHAPDIDVGMGGGGGGDIGRSRGYEPPSGGGGVGAGGYLPPSMAAAGDGGGGGGGGDSGSGSGGKTNGRHDRDGRDKSVTVPGDGAAAARLGMLVAGDGDGGVGAGDGGSGGGARAFSVSSSLSDSVGGGVGGFLGRHGDRGGGGDSDGGDSDDSDGSDDGGGGRHLLPIHEDTIGSLLPPGPSPYV